MAHTLLLVASIPIYKTIPTRPFPFCWTHPLHTVGHVQPWLTRDCHVHMDLHAQHSTSQALLSYKGLSGSPETRTTYSSAWDHEAEAPPPLRSCAPISIGLLPLRSFTFPPARPPSDPEAHCSCPTYWRFPTTKSHPPTKRLQARALPPQKGQPTHPTLPLPAI